MGTAIDELSLEKRNRLAQILDEASHDLDVFGWANGGIGKTSINVDTGNPDGDYPRCVWIAATRALDREPTLKFGHSSYAIDEALIEVSDADSISDLFDINDSHEDASEGKRWAQQTLRNAANYLRGVYVIPSDMATDSLLTQSQESGYTTSVKSRVSKWLRKLHLVK